MNQIKRIPPRAQSVVRSAATTAPKVKVQNKPDGEAPNTATGDAEKALNTARNTFQEAGMSPAMRAQLAQALVGEQQTSERLVVEELFLQQMGELLSVPKIKVVPTANLADIKSGKAPATALPKGVDAAFIPEKNIILVREGLSPSELKQAVFEELGESIASKAGVKIAEGDVGNRLLKVVNGQKLTSADFAKKPADTTTVRFEGQTYTAKARSSADTQVAAVTEFLSRRSSAPLSDATRSASVNGIPNRQIPQLVWMLSGGKALTGQNLEPLVRQGVVQIVDDKLSVNINKLTAGQNAKLAKDIFTLNEDKLPYANPPLTLPGRMKDYSTRASARQSLGMDLMNGLGINTDAFAKEADQWTNRDGKTDRAEILQALRSGLLVFKGQQRSPKAQAVVNTERAAATSTAGVAPPPAPLSTKVVVGAPAKTMTSMTVNVDFARISNGMGWRDHNIMEYYNPKTQEWVTVADGKKNWYSDLKQHGRKVPVFNGKPPMMRIVNYDYGMMSRKSMVRNNTRESGGVAHVSISPAADAEKFGSWRSDTPQEVRDVVVDTFGKPSTHKSSIKWKGEPYPRMFTLMRPKANADGTFTFDIHNSFAQSKNGGLYSGGTKIIRDKTSLNKFQWEDGGNVGRANGSKMDATIELKPVYTDTPQPAQKPDASFKAGQSVFTHIDSHDRIDVEIHDGKKWVKVSDNYSQTKKAFALPDAPSNPKVRIRNRTTGKINTQATSNAINKDGNWAIKFDDGSPYEGTNGVGKRNDEVTVHIAARNAKVPPFVTETENRVKGIFKLIKGAGEYVIGAAEEGAGHLLGKKGMVHDGKWLKNDGKQSLMEGVTQTYYGNSGEAVKDKMKTAKAKMKLVQNLLNGKGDMALLAKSANKINDALRPAAMQMARAAGYKGNENGLYKWLGKEDKLSLDMAIDITELDVVKNGGWLGNANLQALQARAFWRVGETDANGTTTSSLRIRMLDVAGLAGGGEALGYDGGIAGIRDIIIPFSQTKDQTSPQVGDITYQSITAGLAEGNLKLGGTIDLGAQLLGQYRNTAESSGAASAAESVTRPAPVHQPGPSEGFFEEIEQSMSGTFSSWGRQATNMGEGPSAGSVNPNSPNLRPNQPTVENPGRLRQVWNLFREKQDTEFGVAAGTVVQYNLTKLNKDGKAWAPFVAEALGAASGAAIGGGIAAAAIPEEAPLAAVQVGSEEALAAVEEGLAGEALAGGSASGSSGASSAASAGPGEMRQMLKNMVQLIEKPIHIGADIGIGLADIAASKILDNQNKDYADLGIGLFGWVAPRIRGRNYALADRPAVPGEANQNPITRSGYLMRGRAQLNWDIAYSQYY